MLVLLPPIFVARTNIIYGYNLVAPLKTNHLLITYVSRFARDSIHYSLSHISQQCDPNPMKKNFNF